LLAAKFDERKSVLIDQKNKQLAAPDTPSITNSAV
jgi:hypothetical protein